MPPYPNFWRSFAILHFHLCLVPPSGLFLSGSPPNPWTHLLSHPYKNWNTFFWLWKEKQIVICIDTIKEISIDYYKAKRKHSYLNVIPISVCPLCTFFFKLKIETLNCARGVRLCVSCSSCNKPADVCSNGLRFVYLVRDFKTLLG